MGERQKIAFDVNIFDKILSKSVSDYAVSYDELIELYSVIKNYHKIALNNQWLADIENILSIASDHNIVSHFNQLFFRNSRIKYAEVSNTDDKKDYICRIAEYLPQKILITDNTEDIKYKINPYTKEQFLSNKYKSECSLFRIPKNMQYNSRAVLKDFSFLGHYFTDCTLVEFIDPYLIKPDFNSSVDFVISVLGHLNKDVMVRFYMDMSDTYEQKYRKFCRIIEAHIKNIKILGPLNYNKKKNHDRFIIINNNKYSLRFTTSFNNINIAGNTFKTRKNFEIIINTGREYEDL